MMKVRDLMHRHIVGVSSITTIAAALSLAESAKVSLLPVIEGSRLVGIVHIKDLKALQDSGTRIGPAAKRPVFVAEDDDIDKVAKAIIKSGMERIPVVSDRIDMICVGMITATDIVKSRKK